MEELLQIITSFVGSLGFPIAAFFLMFWYVNKKDQEHREEMNALREAIMQLVTSVNNNSVVITELKEMIKDV